MIDWGFLEGSEDAAPQGSQEAPGSSQDDASAEPVGEAIAGTSRAVEHWRRNLERFPSGHIGHWYAQEALEALERYKPRQFDEQGE